MKKKAIGRMRSAKPANKSRLSKIRIVLIDSNQLFRAGIKSLFSSQRDFSIVGEADDRETAIELVKNKKPHIVLLNIEMQDMEGFRMIPELMAACSKSRLAVLTDSSDPEIHRRVVESGVTGIISKQDPPGMLFDAIRRVDAGGAWLDKFVTAKMFVNLPNREDGISNGNKISSLTRREREVIQLIGKGLKNKQIAAQLYISDVTVHHHLSSIYSKLQLENRVELIIFAYQHQLADVPA